MDLELTEDQELLLDTTRRFLGDQWPIAEVRRAVESSLGESSLGEESPGLDTRAVWAPLAELGWTSLLSVDDEAGLGIVDDGIANLAIVAECTGAALLPVPLLASNVVAFGLACWGSGPVQSRALGALVEGTEIAAWAVADGDRWGRDAGGVTATPVAAGFRLDGIKTPVEGTHLADQLLVTATTSDGPAQFLIAADTAGVSYHPLESLDLTRHFSRVELRGVEVTGDALVGGLGVGEPDGADAAIERELALAVALPCAETVGATERAFEMTLDYVKDRKSFGRPIGSYQAIKHRLADMLLWLESAKAVTVAAVKAAGAGGGADAASLAKVYVGDRCPVIVRECLQFHGGIGFTWEHDVHLYLRRVESNAALFGTVDYHRQRLAAALAFPSARESASS